MIGNVEPVDTVPGAESATNDLDAQDEETVVSEFVAHNDWVAQTAVFGIKLIASATTALEAVIGKVEPVDTVPGAELATKDLDAQDELTDASELVAQRDCVAQTAVFGTKLIAAAIVAQLAVIG